LPSRDLASHASNKPSDGPPQGGRYSRGVTLNARAEWYATEEARMVADFVVNWQTVVGGWSKTGDYSRLKQADDDHHDTWSAGTFDNNSTIYELRFLALVAAASGDTERSRAWRTSFLRGLDYVLAAQFPNGGFPQVYPLVGVYHDAITFNDDAMEHAIELLSEIHAGRAPFGFVPETLRREAGRRVEQGVQCVLALQLRDAAGQPTVWAQQYDALTMQPCAARNFEPISECSLESAHLAQFLMQTSRSRPEIVAAVAGAMKWFAARAFHNVTWNRDANEGSGLVPKPGAPDLWARFYEIGTGKPLFGDRDQTVHYVFGEVSSERRHGYGWYHNGAAGVFDAYEKWRE
jgi:PelA/Pel-15E family pectate lyase